MVNGQGCGKKRSWPILRQSQHYPGGTVENENVSQNS
jgi:hypothetical protein